MERLLSDPEFQRELAQVRSKAALQSIGETERPPRWTYVVPRFTRNSAGAMYALETIALQEPESGVNYEQQARQIALAWENLGKLSEGVRSDVAWLNAAIAYELAGYQANAAYLARYLISQPSDDSPTPDIQSLLACFLQRRLVSTRQMSLRIIAHDPDSNSQLDTLAFALGDIVFSDGLANACRFLLSGDTSAHHKAMELLSEATDLFTELGAPLQANLTYGVRALIAKIVHRSTWTQLRTFAESSDVWKRYLTLLARGATVPISRGVTELWPSQYPVIKSGVLGSDESIVVRLPTGGGKTRIAEMAIIDTLSRIPGSKCVFVAPYRALAFEVEKTLGPILNDLGYRVSSVVGSFESDDFEDFLLRTADLLIVTPEKLDLVFRIRPELMGRIKLVVLDEVHVIDDATRGVKFEFLLSRIRTRLPLSRFLVMSAVVPDSTLTAFAKWLTDSPERIFSSSWRPTIQRIARFEWRGNSGRIQFQDDSEMPQLSNFVPGAIRKRNYRFTNPDTQRINNKEYPKTKGATVAELAYVFSEQGTVLVFCTQPNWVQSVSRTILEGSIKYRKLTDEPVHKHFVNGATTKSLELAREWLGEDHIVTKALSQGIAPHHGRLPNIVREAIEADCRDGKYKVIVATNTLAQGVNLPVSVVVFHSTWRTDAEGNRSRISVRDYWNIAGRAGRAGLETEGLIIHVAMTAQDQRDFHYFSNRDNLEPVEGALFHHLEQLTANRLSPTVIESVVGVLDPEILAIAVEEGIESADSDEWSNCLKGTYTALQAEASKIDVEPLMKSVRQAAVGIYERTPEETMRRVYAQTGLSSFSCDALNRFVREYLGDQPLESLLMTAGFDERQALNNLVIAASQLLPEAQTNASFAGDPEDLLGLWLDGKSIQEINTIAHGTTDSIEQLAMYIQDFFGYRLPWISSGLFRIAEAILKIDNDRLAEYVRSYPSMVKYGLPDPVATWAMSVGISTRQTALEIADAFQLGTSEHTHEGFIHWLGSLSDDSLRHDYGITGYTLEDLRYRLRRMSVNPYLQPVRPLRELLPVQEELVGIDYENRWIAARRVKEFDSLELRRDYDNPVDSNAIAVYHDAGKIGFIPRDLAQRIAPEFDAGNRFEVSVKSVTPGKTPVVIFEIGLA